MVDFKLPDLTDQQVDAVHTVVREVQGGSAAKNVLLSAVAGAGKSSTLLAIVVSIKRIDPSANVLFLAFNNEMSRVLRERVANQADVFTLNAFGMHLLRNAIPSVRIEPEKMYRTMRQMCPLRPTPTLSEWRHIQSTVDTYRHTGTMPSPDRPYNFPEALLEQMVADRESVDHTEQIYHCIRHKVRCVQPYDLILVDESQGR